MFIAIFFHTVRAYASHTRAGKVSATVPNHRLCVYHTRGIVVFISIILHQKKGHFVMFNYNEWKVYWIYLSGKLNRWFVLHVIWEWKREEKNQHQPILRKLPMIYMVIYFNCGYWTVFVVLGLKKSVARNVCSFFNKSLRLPQYITCERAKKVNNNCNGCNHYD